MNHKVKALIRKYALRNAVKFDGKGTAGAVMGKVMGESEECRKDPQGTKQMIHKIVEEVNRMSLEEQTAELKKILPEYFEEQEIEDTNRLPELEGDKIVMRMAPYPSGPLHIGNARMAVLNDEYVKRTGGKLLLVYDDTIGSEQKKPLVEAYDLIKDGLEWLGVEWHGVHYKSERMEIYYDHGEKLVADGAAYVCECSAEKLRRNREKGIDCEHRTRTIEDNLKHWNAMLKGTFDEGDAVVRIKTDMEHPNPAFRDRVLFRISKSPHPLVGDKYHVWPLLEFSWAVDDHLLGMTHVLRGKDLVIEDEMEKYIWDLFGWDHCEFLHYGMLRLKEFKLSKSDFQRKLRNNELCGWDDPRTWSLQSLRKRGIQPEALREFILDFGMSLTDIEVPASKLYAKNREFIDARANRYYFVPQPVKIELDGELEIDVAKIPRHPDYPERGTRVLPIDKTVYIPRDEYEDNLGKEIRLKNLCNIMLYENKAEITSIENKDILKIQWVPKGIDCTVEMPDGTREKGLVEATFSEVRGGDIVQFERYGFVRLIDIEHKVVAFAHR